MSMLAERKRKTKWVINPTKKPIWTTDSEGIKLGKQLMEKMGWSAGKGLGAKEQGIQEPLKVSYKNDTKGMGFKGNDEDWMEHQDEFNSLLNQLSSSDPSKSAELDRNEIKSLEEKSKHSRARVHYQKFTRGKDLSRYSETDLACILGINHNKKQKNPLEEKNPVDEKTDGSYETSFGVTTINSGSILDYFKKKWTIGKFNQNNSSKSLDELPEETVNHTEGYKLTLEPKKTKKRKLDEVDGGNQQLPEDKTIETEEVENSEVVEEVKKIKKSKKQKHNELSGENLEVPENEIIEASEEVDNLCNSELGKESKKHKKSKRKKNEDLNIEYGNVSKAHQKENCDADNNNQIEEDNKDIKFTGGVENVSGHNNLSLASKKYEPLQLLRENSQNIDDDLKRKRKKDKKKHKIKELDTLENLEEPVEEDFDHRIKKKKKKDKEKKEKENVAQNEINVPSDENYLDKDKSESKSISYGDEKIEKLDLVEETAMANAVDSPSEKSRKEKRRKENHRLDKFTPENNEELKIKRNIAVEEVESEPKSRKRKRKLTDQALVENEEEPKKMNKNILEEVEPIVREKKKKKKYKTDESKPENEKEEETETRITSEDVEEFKIKEKKKKSKHRSDQSTLEDEEEQVTKSKSIPEEIEPEITGKKSKKSKSSEGKKSKHKTDNEGVDDSNINSESVQETNDDINTIQKQSEKSKKVDVDTKVKEDSKNLVKENEPKKDESKTEYDSRIHSHKVELFKKKKKLSLLGAFPENSPNSRVMGLIFGAEFEKFKGSNLEKLVGYGMQKKNQGKCDV